MFISGLIVFFGIHLVPFFPKTKNALHSRMGENPYMGTFSFISLIGLLMIIFGYERAIDNLYPIYSYAYAYSEYLMFVSLTFLVAAYLPTHLKKITKHPMSIGIGIWALLHLAVNPDIISVILFGGFLAYSVLDILVSEFKKEEKKLYEAKILYDVLSVVVAVLILPALLSPPLTGSFIEITLPGLTIAPASIEVVKLTTSDSFCSLNNIALPNL